MQNNHAAAINAQQQQLATISQQQGQFGGGSNAQAGNATIRSLHEEDLPQYGAQSHKDSLELLLRFETWVTPQNRLDHDKLRRLALAFYNNVSKCHRANPFLTAWYHLRPEFLKTFGKTRFRLDLAEESAKMLASGDPLG